MSTMKVLFVCHANVCRSFMAQELLKHFLPQVETLSRGLYVDPSLEVPQKVKDFLLRAGITPAVHTPAQLSAADMQTADLVLFMEQNQLEEVIDRFSEYTDKCYLLLDFAFEREQDIADPILLTGRAFEKQAQVLRQAVEACAQYLSASK